MESTILEIIRRENRKTGVLPFARFMELALYCPECGYYETKKDIGRCGDFYTSVSAGELFGQLLALQFAEWLEESETLNAQPSTLSLVEAGAHDGRLAKDILTWLQSNRPNLFARLDYTLVEPSARRRQWQAETLLQFTGKFNWQTDLSGLKDRQSASGDRRFTVIFSNELLDAFPIRRFGWNAQKQRWFEWGVAIAGDHFTWAKIEDPQLPSFILRLPTPLVRVLPDGYVLETSPAAESWWRQAAAYAAPGKLMAIDYGLTEDEMISPARTHGTLRGYFQHRLVDDVLANPGEQDLTAHVNFSAIRQTGEAAGLTTGFFGSQAKFLTEILVRADRNRAFGVWTARQTRQFQTLTHPEHLGRAFRVLVQARHG